MLCFDVGSSVAHLNSRQDTVRFGLTQSTEGRLSRKIGGRFGGNKNPYLSEEILYWNNKFRQQ